LKLFSARIAAEELLPIARESIRRSSSGIHFRKQFRAPLD
jgi:hypothetical protein